MINQGTPVSWRGGKIKQRQHGRQRVRSERRTNNMVRSEIFDFWINVLKKKRKQKLVVKAVMSSRIWLDVLNFSGKLNGCMGEC